MKANQLLELLEIVGITGDIQENSQNAINLADRLKNLAHEFSNPRPNSLWQEIKAFPTISKYLFNRHIITSLHKASEEFKEASKSGTLTGFAQAVFNSGYIICKGFDDFFIQLSQDSPKIHSMVAATIKLACVTAICIVAPYLSPLAIGIGMSIYNDIYKSKKDLQLSEITTDQTKKIPEKKHFAINRKVLKQKFLMPRSKMLKKKIYQTKGAFENLKKHSELSNVSDLLAQTLQISATHNIKAEKIAALGLNAQQLAIVAAGKKKDFAFLSSLADCRDLIPRSKEIGVFYTKNVRAELTTKLDKCLLKNTLQQSKELLALFEKITAPAFDQMQDIAYDKGLFYSAAQVAKFSQEKLKPALAEFIGSCPESPKLRKEIATLFQQTRDEKLTQILKPILKNIKSSQQQFKQLGMKSKDYDILRNYAELTSNKTKAHLEQYQLKKTHPRINRIVLENLMGGYKYH